MALKVSFHGFSKGSGTDAGMNIEYRCGLNKRLCFCLFGNHCHIKIVGAGGGP